MLTLLLGTAGTGKTRTVLDTIKQRATEKKQSILLVPEQFSAAVEGTIYRFMGDSLSMFVTSCSFRTLAERILDRYGGGELPLMSDAGRAVLVRRAMDSLEPELLGRFSGQKRSAAFCAACADVIQEMKTAGVTPDILWQAGKTQPRLKQLSYIYGGYQSLLKNTALDPSDCLTIAAQKVQPEFFGQTEIFADGFDGFTAPQYQLLEKLLTDGASLTVSLCCDSLSGTEELFAPARQTAQRLSRIAARSSAQTKVKILQENLRHPKNSGMAMLTEALSQNLPLSHPPQDVWVVPSENAWQQAKTAAAFIAQKAREGVPYSKMALVCRNKEPYAAALRWECDLMGIPLFEDEPAMLQFSPCALFFKAAAGLAQKGLNTEQILELLKTGLVQGADIEQTALLETYTQVWRMKAKDWTQPLPSNRTLAGFEGDENDPQEQYELAQAEAARAAVIPALEQFCSQTAPARTAKGMNGGKLCKALYQLLEQVNAAEQAAELAQRAKQNSEAEQEELHRMWEAAMLLLDELYRLTENEKITAVEFSELLGLMLKSTELGKIPEKLEGLLFTTADRLQAQGVEYCFVLGANEGEFPQIVGASGLLTHTDRDLLKEVGANLPGEFEQRVRQEDLYFYRTATAASKQTVFLFREDDIEGRLTRLLSEIRSEQGWNVPQISPLQMCPTPKAALDWMCGKGGEETAKELAEFSQHIKELEQKSETPVFKVEDSHAMEQILGRDLTVSPSRMERFYRCKLAYFLEYIVRLKTPRPAKLDAMLSGSLVHYILEKALQDNDFLNVSETDAQQQMEHLARRLAQEYMQQLPKHNNEDPLTKREKNVVERIVRGMVPLLEFLQQEQKQSRFKPTAYELTIGDRETQGLLVPLQTITPPT